VSFFKKILVGFDLTVPPRSVPGHLVGGVYWYMRVLITNLIFR